MTDRIEEIRAHRRVVFGRRELLDRSERAQPEATPNEDA